MSKSTKLTSQFIAGLEELAERKGISKLALFSVIRRPSSEFYRWRKGTVNINVDTIEDINTLLKDEFGECVEVSFS
jgi:hypothetical protein